MEAEIDDDLRHDIVNYVKRTVDSEQFPDVADWGLELWRLSTAAVGSEEEYHHLLSALQEALPPEEPDSGFARDYMREQLLLLMTELMERFGDQEQAESIRLENRHLAEFREALLSRAWSEEEFETVIRLAEEGIARDTHLPGLLKQWRVWALEACRAANRIEEARRTARDLVLAGDPEFLTTYRDLVPSDGWPAAREVRDAILLEFPRRPAMRDELQNAATPRRRDY